MVTDFDNDPYQVTGLFADAEIVVVNDAIPGPRGPEGPEGPRGVDGKLGGLALEDVSYVHTQATPLAVWYVKHGLNFYPNVTVVDSAGSVVEGNITYLDRSSTVLSFGAAFSGEAYFS